MKEVTKNYFVSPQIIPGDIELLKEQGFEVIVCNRPDKEEPNQPDFESINKECSRLGLKFYNHPISPGDLNLERVLEPKRILEEEKRH